MAGLLGVANVVFGVQSQAFFAGLATARTEMARTTAAMEANLVASSRRQGSALGAVGRAAGIVAVGGLAAFAVAAKKGVTAASQFEDSLDKIVGLVGVSRKQVDEWGRVMLELGPKLGKAPKELADAMFFVTSAGLRGADALDALTWSARASAAGLGETQVIADAVTSAMNAYKQAGLTAAQATDILTATITAGKMPPEELAGTLGKVISVGATAKVSFAELGAAIASMTRLGFDSSEATTALRGALLAMAAPTAKAQKQLAELGLSGAQIRKVIAEQGLLAALKMLAGAMAGNLDVGRRMIPNVRALSGFLAMMGDNVEATTGVFRDLDHVQGRTMKALGVAQKDAEHKFKQFHAAVNAVLIELGNVLLPTVTKAAARAARALTEHRDDIKAAFEGAARGVRTVADALRPIARLADRVADAIGGWDTVFATVIGVKVLGWVAKLVAGLSVGIPRAAAAGAVGVETSAAAMGASVATVGARVATLRSALLGLGKLGLIAIPIALVLHEAGVTGKAKGAVERAAGALGLPTGVERNPEQLAAPGYFKQPAWVREGLGKEIARKATRDDLSKLATAIARGTGIDPMLFLALIGEESGWRTDAVSKAGARGLTQLMPGTAAGLLRAGFGKEFTPEQAAAMVSADPLLNLVLGAQYLKQQLAAQGGDVRKALAAYNAGPEAVRRYGGVPPYKETQAYVERVTKAAGIGREPSVGGVLDWIKGLGERALGTISQGQIGRHKAVLRPGADRPGAATSPKLMEFAEAIANVMAEDVTIGTGTQHSRYVKGSTAESDHWRGMAIDIPATGDDLILLGQAALIVAGMDPVKARTIKRFAGQVNGWSIIFGVNLKVGGDHTNHLHVGVHPGTAASAPKKAGAGMTPAQRAAAEKAEREALERGQFIAENLTEEERAALLAGYGLATPEQVEELRRLRGPVRRMAPGGRAALIGVSPGLSLEEQRAGFRAYWASLQAMWERGRRPGRKVPAGLAVSPRAGGITPGAMRELPEFLAAIAEAVSPGAGAITPGARPRVDLGFAPAGGLGPAGLADWGQISAAARTAAAVSPGLTGVQRAAGRVAAGAYFAGLGTVAGLAGVRKRFDELQAGRLWKTATVKGIGKILLPLAPTIRDWQAMRGALTKKLKAAVQRQATLKRQLQRVAKAKHKDATLIGNLQTAYKTITATVVELRQDIGLCVAAIKDLRATQRSAAQQAAEEREEAAEAAAEARAEASAEEAETAAEAVAGALAEAEAGLTELPVDVREALVTAEGTADTTDDLAALRRAEQVLAGRLDTGLVEALPGVFSPMSAEARINLRGELNRVRREITALTDAAAAETQRIADEAKEKADREAEGATRAAAEAADAFERGLLAVPAELDYALAQAEGSLDLADDLDVLRRLEALFAGRLSEAKRVETQADIQRSLNRARDQINRILEEQKRAAAPAAETTAQAVVDTVLPSREQIDRALEERVTETALALTGVEDTLAQRIEENRVGFLSAIRELRGFASNLLEPLRGSVITVNNYFAQAPSDPHLFTRALEFELKALVA